MRREWTFFAWLALGNLDKYLRRNSPWEALRALEEARTHLLRLHAAALDVPYPEFGLTSILDVPAAELPERLDETLAGLDPVDIVRAASVCADLLDGYEPRPLGHWVRQRLAAA